MQKITITSNDAGRRLDRFLRKYLPGAALGEIYRIIRKDVKVDSKRRNESYILNEGEVLTLYLPDDELLRLSRGRAGGAHGQGNDQAESAAAVQAGHSKARRTFGIIYEDDDILIAGKPFGLLTHGDSHEKKNHLANQVKDYLIASGSYDPRNEKVFVPAPVNRLDRNTTGIVLFGKTAPAMRVLSRMIREEGIRKSYLTVACGEIRHELYLGGTLVKDETANKVRVSLQTASDSGKDDDAHRAGQRSDASGRAAAAKAIETIVRPLEVLRFGKGLTATLCEVELVTGRSHQIRAHLASTGHPLIGDSKYAGGGSAGRDAAAVNKYVRERFGLTTQLLHACRIEFALDSEGSLPYTLKGADSAAEENTEEARIEAGLSGRTFTCPPPERFSKILRGLGSRHKV